jgi:hypothetical protein
VRQIMLRPNFDSTWFDGTEKQRRNVIGVLHRKSYMTFSGKLILVRTVVFSLCLRAHSKTDIST